jgi:Uma2 family endonuclease
MYSGGFVFMMTAEEIRKTISEGGYTLAQLEKFSGVPVATIQKIVSGTTKAPRKETLYALSRILMPWNPGVLLQPEKKENEVKTPEEELLMTAEEMAKEVDRRGYSYAQLERFTGIPAATIRRIMTGKTKRPRIDVMLSLSAVLRPTAADNSIKHQESYDLGDYLALTDDDQIEMIDGVLYDTVRPDEVHQFVLGAVFHTLYEQTRKLDRVCYPFMAPLDVQLDENDRTIVKPDIFIAFSGKRFKDGRYQGAPEFVAEILSLSSRKKDFHIKYFKYKQAGVREYWIVDIMERRIITWVFHDQEKSRVYTIDETVPVMAFEGKISVDFGQIWKEMSDYFTK